MDSTLKEQPRKRSNKMNQKEDDDLSCLRRKCLWTDLLSTDDDNNDYYMKISKQNNNFSHVLLSLNSHISAFLLSGIIFAEMRNFSKKILRNSAFDFRVFLMRKSGISQKFFFQNSTFNFRVFVLRNFFCGNAEIFYYRILLPNSPGK